MGNKKVIESWSMSNGNQLKIVWLRKGEKDVKKSSYKKYMFPLATQKFCCPENVQLNYPLKMYLIEQDGLYGRLFRQKFQSFSELSCRFCTKIVLKLLSNLIWNVSGWENAFLGTLWIELKGCGSECFETY